jgi:choline kinase
MAERGGNGYPSEEELAALDGAVAAWSAASHGMWAVWGIVQAREQVGGVDGVDGEFDYLGYAASRMALFRDAVGVRGGEQDENDSTLA